MSAAHKLRPGAEAVMVGGCVLGYRYAGKRGHVVRVTPTCGRMARRRGEIGRAGQWLARHDPGTPIDQSAWAAVIADTTIFCDPDGGSLAAFQRVADDAGVSIDDTVALAALHAVDDRIARQGANAQSMNGTRAGKLLGLTCEQRLDAAIITMWAIDETRVERRQRVAAARRERDRLRKRQVRAAAPEPLKRPTQEAARPWAAQGMSRAQWFRLGKPMSAAESRETKSCPRPNSIGTKAADAVLSHVEAATAAAGPGAEARTRSAALPTGAALPTNASRRSGAERGERREAGAKARLADEYDAAQERGEVAKHGGGQGKGNIPKGNVALVADIGLSSKDIHEARKVRDAGAKPTPQPNAAKRAPPYSDKAQTPPADADNGTVERIEDIAERRIRWFRHNPEGIIFDASEPDQIERSRAAFFVHGAPRREILLGQIAAMASASEALSPTIMLLKALDDAAAIVAQTEAMR